jgi:hypothetical protein
LLQTGLDAKQGCSKLVRDMGQVLLQKFKETVGNWWSGGILQILSVVHLSEDGHKDGKTSCFEHGWCQNRIATS